MNDITTPKGTALGGLAGLKANLQQVRHQLPAAGNTPYLRMLTDGDWVFGQEDNAVAHGDEAVINPTSIKLGYTCWTDHPKGGPKNECLDEIMYPLGAVLPGIHTMRDMGWPWSDVSSMDVKIISGKHEGVETLYKTSSKGGINAIRGIIDAILARLEEDSEYVCPVITFGNDSYKHKQWGKTYVPVLNIVSWMDMDGNEDPAFVQAGDAPLAVGKVEKAAPAPDADELAEKARAEHRAEQKAEEPAPARRRAPAADVPDAETVSEQAPVRRRRTS